MKSTIRVVILVYVFCQIVPFLQVNGDGEINRKAVDMVLELLENYDNGAKSSGLTEELLQEAYKEYKSWSPLELVRMRANPKIHLLIHFLFVPLGRIPQQLGTREDTLTIPVEFITRLEQNYKKFKPHYFGKKVGLFSTKSPKTDALIEALASSSDETGLNPNMVMQAYQEYQAYSDRLKDIIEFDDIYSALDEFEKLKNYVNRFEVKVLNEIVFPAFMARRNSKGLGVKGLAAMFKMRMLDKPKEDSLFKKMFGLF